MSQDRFLVLVLLVPLGIYALRVICLCFSGQMHLLNFSKNVEGAI